MIRSVQLHAQWHGVGQHLNSTLLASLRKCDLRSKNVVRKISSGRPTLQADNDSKADESNTFKSSNTVEQSDSIEKSNTGEENCSIEQNSGSIEQNSGSVVQNDDSSFDKVMQYKSIFDYKKSPDTPSLTDLIYEDFKMRPDPKAEERRAQKKKNLERVKSRQLEQNLHRLMSLYHQSQRFITTPEQLNEAVEQAFDDFDTNARPYQSLTMLQTELSPVGNIMAKKVLFHKQRLMIAEIQDQLSGTSGGSNIGPGELLPVMKNYEAIKKEQEERLEQLLGGKPQPFNETTEDHVEK